MSTFIYQNGILYADTRKIINFPGREMMGSTIESKVNSNAWSHIAVSGFEKQDTWYRRLRQRLTVIECFYALVDVLNEIIKHKPDIEADATEMIIDLMDLVDGYIETVSASITEPFLAVTKRHVYGFDGDLADTKTKIVVHETNSIEVVGSAYHAARILLFNGVAPKDIYTILRHGYAPVGENFEQFKISDLSDAMAPWCGRDVWIYYAAELKANPSSITLEQKNQLLALYMLRSKMGTISNNTIRAKKNGIIEVIEMWSNKGYLQLPNFKENFEAMFE